MAECANESIGIQIGGITIEDSQQVVQEPIRMTFNASEATTRANVEDQKITAGIAAGGGKEKKQDDGYGGHTEQEGGTGKGEGPSGNPLESNE